MSFVYITCKDKKEARKISKHLLEKRLIACSNMFPIKSMYLWKGKIEEDKEYVIIAKILEKNFSKVKKEVKLIHSYDVPCICLIKSEANKDYSDWVKKEVK
jgi:periplasmic divalent cation tolerance protein